jgi:hypothetical protein
MNDRPTLTTDLQFLVNTGDAPAWREYKGVWNSGSDTSVTIRIFTNVEFVGATYVDNIKFSQVSDDPYVEWKNDHGIVNDAGDEDKDGYENLMEYALGRDPRSAISDKVPAISKSVNGFEFKFRRNQVAITYSIEKSSDLINWQNFVNVSDVHGAVGSDATVWVPLSEMSNGKLFLRLKVEN